MNNVQSCGLLFLACTPGRNIVTTGFYATSTDVRFIMNYLKKRQKFMRDNERRKIEGVDDWSVRDSSINNEIEK